jgi:hypothetical protein
VGRGLRKLFYFLKRRNKKSPQGKPLVGIKFEIKKLFDS